LRIGQKRIREIKMITIVVNKKDFFLVINAYRYNNGGPHKKVMSAIMPKLIYV
jgi:hypothetical protein